MSRRKPARLTACKDPAAFGVDFPTPGSIAKIAIGVMRCALCFRAVERIAAIFGELFETLINITVEDSNGWPVGMTVPKYRKVHICAACFKTNDNVYIDGTPYKSFNALATNIPNESSLAEFEYIPTTQEIDPHDDNLDRRGSEYVMRGGALVTPDGYSNHGNNYLNWKANRHVRKTTRSGGISKSIGKHIQPQTITLKPSPRTKQFMDMVDELSKGTKLEDK